MKIYWTYDEVLERVTEAAKEVLTLGNTVDSSPIVVAQSGGEKEPAIFITAGSHATEHAGVSAAVALIDQLETDHKVYVIPTRDPVGLNGYAYALSLGLGDEPEFDSFGEVEDILRNEGEVLFEEDDMVLSLIGDYGYASARPATDRDLVEYGHEQ